MIYSISGNQYYDWVTETIHLPPSVKPYYVILHTVSFAFSLLSILFGAFLVHYHFFHLKHGLFGKFRNGVKEIRPMPNECLLVFLMVYGLLDIVWHLSLLYEWGGRLANTLFFHVRYTMGYTGLVLFHTGIMYTLPPTLLNASANKVLRKQPENTNPTLMNAYVICFPMLALFGIGGLAVGHGTSPNHYSLHLAIWIGWTLLVAFFGGMIQLFGRRLISTVKLSIAFQKENMNPSVLFDSLNQNPLENSQATALARSRPSTSHRLSSSMQQRELKLRLLEASLKQLQITFWFLSLSAFAFGLVNLINLVLWDVVNPGYYIPSTIHILSGPATTLVVYIAFTFKAMASMSVTKLMKQAQTSMAPDDEVVLKVKPKATTASIEED